jgi:hypothetical protein
VLPHNQRLHQLLLLAFKSDNSDGDSKFSDNPQSNTKSAFIINMHYIMHIFPHLVALFVELSLQQVITLFLEQKIVRLS